jgi:hypothetical protein
VNARGVARVPTVESGNEPGHDEEDIVRTRTRLAAAGTLVAALVLTPAGTGTATAEVRTGTPSVPWDWWTAPPW